MATTLLQLRTRARERADMVNSTFVSNSEANTWINQGLFELYDLIVNAYEDYFTSATPTTLQIASGNVLTLPADFYKLRGLDYSPTGAADSYLPCRPYNFTDRNQSTVTNLFYLSRWAGRQYRIMGDNILIEPRTSAAGSYNLYYTTAASPLVTDTDTIPSSLSKFGWDEYIVLYVAERMLSKEESSITDVVNERADIARRIERMKGDRQVDQPESVSDNQGSIARNGYGGPYDY